MIDHRLVTQGTNVYFVIKETLALACGVIDDDHLNTSKARGGTKGECGRVKN